MPAGYPRHNLAPASSPWATRVQAEQQQLRDDFTRYKQAQDNGANSGTSTLALLTKQVKMLTAMSAVQYAEWSTGATGFTGFYTLPTASVQLVCPTGRVEVGFGGSLNSGSGYFCYSITGATTGLIVDRALIQANPARRVAVTGGASFTPSGHNQLVENVPASEVLTIKVEMYAVDNFVFFMGAHIFARVAP